jgi:hypothetical protein
MKTSFDDSLAVQMQLRKADGKGFFFSTSQKKILSEAVFNF